jgi:hypothetical protein
MNKSFALTALPHFRDQIFRPEMKAGTVIRLGATLTL